MNNTDIAQVIEPFEKGFSKVFRLAWKGVIRTVPYLGIPTKIERANCMHRAIRNLMRPFCETLSPILEFVEEPDGQGKDYIIIDSGKSKSLALCWGRFGNGEIRRSQTIRNQFIQEQGYLFAIEDGLSATQVTATIGYDVADDFTEGGKPCWWIQRLVLLRERCRESEFIKNVCCYKKPKLAEVVVEDYDSRIRDKEYRQVEQIADVIRRKIG
jgi:hypothetical protein